MKNDSVVARETSGSFDTFAAIGVGGLEIGRQHFERVDIGGGVLLQIEIGRDRLGVGIAQVERVEVEAQPIERGQQDDDHADDAPTAPLSRLRSRNASSGASAV